MPTRQRKRKDGAKLDQDPRLSAPKAKQNLSYCTTGCLTLTVLCAVIQAMLMVLLLVPSPISPVSFKLPPLPKMPPTSQINHENSIRLFEGKLVGPESLVVSGIYLFTGTYDKGVIRINTLSLEFSQLPVYGEPPCGTPALEPTCGRPLGLRIHQGSLYVLDSYLGLFKYDLSNIDQPAVQLFNGTTFGNDLAISSEGLIYYTDSSRKWQRRNFPELFLENPTDGLLVQFNETSGEKKILSDTLSFANGVELSHNEDFIMVAETNRARIARYWLKGKSKGFWDYINPNLPGLPDNVRQSKRGTYWIGFGAARTEGFTLLETFSEWPYARGIIAKLYRLYPDIMLKFITKTGFLAEMDNNGNLLQAFCDNSGNLLPSISEVEEAGDGVMYLGSYGLPFLTKVTINKL